MDKLEGGRAKRFGGGWCPVDMDWVLYIFRPLPPQNLIKSMLSTPWRNVWSIAGGMSPHKREFRTSTSPGTASHHDREREDPTM